MRFPSDRSMEAVLVLALGLIVIVVILALREAPGDRTRFTVEPAPVTQVSERRAPLEIEETALGR
jgi:hypothetical protein